MALQDYTHVAGKFVEYNSLVHGLPGIEKDIKREKKGLRDSLFKESSISRSARKDVIRVLKDKWNVQYSKALSIHKLMDYMATLDAGLARSFICQVMSLFENQKYDVVFVQLNAIAGRWIIVPECQMKASEEVLRYAQTEADLDQFLKSIRGVKVPDDSFLTLLEFYKCRPVMGLCDFPYMYDAIYMLMEMRFSYPELELSQIVAMVMQKLGSMAIRVRYSRVLAAK
ncbi:MAG: hypothetical protein K2M17_01485 [Bacilli bacterium]|nr:hypothetical protein [Bacilli bacterium]